VTLRERIEAQDRDAFVEFRAALNAGTIRAAERNADGQWVVNTWVKQGILTGFRMGVLTALPDAGPMRFFDKDTFPTRALTLDDKVRVVPGGTSVRDGASVAPGVIVMPPAYINVGAWVGEGTLVDSHALVGSCAQIGKRVHLSAAAQIGGVLEPAGARPVIIEDDVLVGGGCGVYEGTIVRERAVLAAGTIITGSTPIYDLIRGVIHRREVPAGAVVVPGARPASGDQAKAWGVQLATPVIVKYRDEQTNAAAALEEALR
jgi:2,3,4,5-tetrahydropyridine-2-carboxylate N-succinyltransferase